jgi:hypothetical protein
MDRRCQSPPTRTLRSRCSAKTSSGERIVVMIDDVDRTDPTLVPPILFALREVFDIPRFSWLLAVDPVVIRAALERHHPGFGLGRDYLEKIVDFPFVISPPEPARKVELLIRDLRARKLGWDKELIEELREMLPANPRELRAIVRHLISIAPSVDRHGPDELSRRLLLALVVIYTASPKLLAQLVEDENRLRMLTGLRFFMGDERENKVLADAEKEIDALLDSVGALKSDRTRLRASVFHLGKADYWPAEQVAATANLLHTSPVMTALEAQRMLDDAEDASALAGCLRGFADDEGRALCDVRLAFFNELVASHGREMNNVTGAPSGDLASEAVRRVAKVVETARILLFDLGAVADVAPSGFERMHGAFSQWAFVVHPPECASLREAERTILLRFAGAPALDAVAALESMKPNRSMGGFGGNQDGPRRRLYIELRDILERRTVEMFIGRLSRENAFAVLEGESRRRSGHFIFRGRGRIWRQEFRERLKGELAAAGRSAACAQNALLLLGNAVSLAPERAPALMVDMDLIQVLWAAATAITPNFRRFDTFAELRDAIEKASDQRLVVPPWWETIKAQQAVAAVARAKSEDDEVQED